MTLFQQSSLTLTEAKQQIADSAGVSADNEFLTRAERSFAAAIRHWNNVANWRSLEVEHDAITVIAPFTVSGCALTSGSTTITTTVANGFSDAGVTAYDLLTGSGTRLDMQVLATGATSITANLGASATVTGVTLTFTRDLYDLPSDFKAVYTARLLSQPRPLKFVGRRLYDRVTYDQTSVSTPEFYDLYPLGKLGKIRMIPPPNASDALKLRYYRRMSPTATPIDIHTDWEPYFISWAKWHMLTDKGGNAERAAEWKTLAQEGIGQMLKLNKNVPDEELAFMPSTSSLFTNPNTTVYAFTDP